ncbi:MAG: class I SAM-dependent methyltransferase [Anaerolineae bacterium]|nr:class I SAM-dependent methyltransferase [Anaerolineae bacterium]
MDEVSRYNLERWNALVDADALFTRPYLHLDAEAARQRVDRDGMLGDMSGKDVLLLASGGGQQSVAFALLGARVTVVDLSDKQLERDRQAAAHYGFELMTQQADMRDLSALNTAAFDLVYHPYSLNFVPDATEVFAQAARVIRPGGMYYFMCANPFASGLTENSWNGEGYLLKEPYLQGEKIVYPDSDWVYDRSKYPAARPIQGPQEFRQTLSTLLNGLVAQGFLLLRLKEIMADAVNQDAEPGTWDHFTAVVPPWFGCWTTYRPDIFGQ